VNYIPRLLSVKYLTLLIGIGTIVLAACNRPSSTSSIGETSPSSSINTNVIIAPSAGVSSPTVSISPLVPTTPITTATVAPLPTIKLPVGIGDYQVIDELKQPQFMAQSKDLFKSTKLPNTQVSFNAVDLLVVLKSTRKYFKNRLADDLDLQREGILASQGVTVNDVVKTLDFMILTINQDLKAKRAIRLQNPKFLNTHFRAIQWQAFDPKVTDEKRIRLTKYAVFTHSGSRQPTKEYNVGLYALKPDTDIDRIRLKYTKQDILKNIYEPNGSEHGAVEPLAYLDRDGLESALMEGTVLIKFTDGTSAYFNVDRNNNIPYVKGLDPREQKRYWYFKPVNTIKGYGQTIETKISLKPGVTFAGDVLNIGLGKIVVTESDTNRDKPELRMGIIADTGGAFLPNLHQLDFLAGVFDTKADFTTYIRTLPEYTKAYILVKR
jgi:membrane-bound lytic murein transglycosylase